LWRYETVRLEEFLQRLPLDKTRETRRIFDKKGALVAQYNDKLEWPLVRRSYPLLDSGHIAGMLEISRSLRTLFIHTAYFTLGGTVLGILMFAFIRMFPLHALSETLESLNQLNKTLQQRVNEEVEKGRAKDHLLMHQSKLAAMGEMIGSIAHQWRQPLNAVGLIIQDIKTARQFGELDKEYLAESVGRAMAIIQHMSVTIDDFRYFYRPEKEPRTFSIGEAVVKAISVIEASFKNNHIEIELDVKDDIVVEGFPNEYSQVLLNLLNNAKDVFIEKGIARPKVSLQLFRQDNRAVLTVKDNGGGIPMDIMDKIFEPYFSTKSDGKGTGIGLYMSKMIIEKSMNGKLTAANTGDGAEFRVEM
jgi:signal transduction histidine kinase